MSRVLTTRKSRKQLVITIGSVLGFAFVIYGLYGAYLALTAQSGGLTGFQIGAKVATVYLCAVAVVFIAVLVAHIIKRWVNGGSTNNVAQTPEQETVASTP